MTTPGPDARRLAWRWGLIATAVTAVVVYGAGVALGHDMAQTTVSFVVFAALFGGTAAFVGPELVRHRTCPRCGLQQSGRVGDCDACGYDVKQRPRFVCSEGHASYDAGLCDCGRRRQLWTPPDVARHVRRSVLFGAALLAAMLIAGLLLN